MLLLATGTARAQAAEEKPEDEKLVCSQAFEQAQRLRNETHYVAANQEVLKCANPKCGDAIFQECTKIYTELQGAIPSVVFAARDAARNVDLVDVVVTIDGNPGVDQIDGRPIQVDPGTHTFAFTAGGYPTVERQVVIRAGEKFRQVSVMLGSAAPVAVAPAAPAPVAPPPEESSKPRKVPVASYVLGAVGVVALGGFVGLQVAGSHEYDTLKSGCSPTCSDSDVSRVRQKYIFSYAALGVSAAAFIGAVTFYFAQPRESSNGLTTALAIGPTPNGAAARFVAHF